MVTVIIPVLNEESTIQYVIDFAKACELVSEVIVVDDKSIDDTVRKALDKNVVLVTSTRLGKGTSMKEGLLFAKNEIVVFLDGDINPYPPDTIENLVHPIINNKADLTKANFSRNAGRVTELVAKPLISIFFPDLLKFKQPLSGMIAARKIFLAKQNFSDDYGVDIGILIDSHLSGARLLEVTIGHIENKSKPWNALSKMSREVSMTIISKAAYNKNSNYNFEILTTLNEIRSQMELTMGEHLKQFKKIVFFDMDNTLIQGSFINEAGIKLGITDKIMAIRSENFDLVVQIKKMAALLKGFTLFDLIQITDNIPVIQDAIHVIKELKKRNYIVGIISHSFDCIANHIKTKLGLDFSIGHELEFSKGICTGEVKIPSMYFYSEKNNCSHTLCKTHAINHLLEKYEIDLKNSIAVGDSIYDLCMIKQCGFGVSFCTKDELLLHQSDLNIHTKSLQKLLKIAS